MRQSAKGCAAQIGRAIQPQQVILEYPRSQQLRATAIDMQPIGCIIAGVDADTDKVFKALADPGRRLLLDRLHAGNGRTLGQLCEQLDMTRQAATKHVKLLEEATLVVTFWRGREKLHYLNPVPILEIADRWIGKFERGRLRVLADLKKNLEGETDG
jgi:DNA-binding transcriptional ArsR family regulator